MCNPHNPTGTVHSPAELAALAALAEEHGVRVVADEIHAPLVYDGGPGFTPYLTVPGAERGFSVFSPSKGWNLAGLKSALAMAGPGAVDDFRAAARGEHARLVAPRGDRARGGHGRRARQWLEQLVGELDANRALLGRLLAEHLPGVRWQAPEATYLAWLDCRDLGLGDDPARVFRDRGRVALGSGPWYGREGRGFARLNFATSPAILEEAVRRMASVALTAAPVERSDALQRASSTASAPRRHHGGERRRVQLVGVLGRAADGRGAEPAVDGEAAEHVQHDPRAGVDVELQAGLANGVDHRLRAAFGQRRVAGSCRWSGRRGCCRRRPRASAPTSVS